MKNFILFSVGILVLASQIPSASAELTGNDVTACKDVFNRWYVDKYAQALEKLPAPPFNMTVAEAEQRAQQIAASLTLETAIRNAGLELCSKLN